MCEIIDLTGNIMATKKRIADCGYEESQSKTSRFDQSVFVSLFSIPRGSTARSNTDSGESETSSSSNCETSPTASGKKVRPPI